MAESNNFKSSELCCKGKECCGGYNGATQELVNSLENLRRLGGDNATVLSSVYRCPKHNANVGSRHTSFHSKGLAADVVRIGNFYASNEDGAKQIQALMEKNGMWTYIGKGFVHGDLRDRSKR